jgi:hypothetical protein
MDRERNSWGLGFPALLAPRDIVFKSGEEAGCVGMVVAVDRHDHRRHDFGIVFLRLPGAEVSKEIPQIGFAAVAVILDERAPRTFW